MPEPLRKPPTQEDILGFLSSLAAPAARQLAQYGQDVHAQADPLYVAGLLPTQEGFDVVEGSVPRSQITIDADPDRHPQDKYLTYLDYVLTSMSPKLTRPGLETRIITTHSVKLVQTVGKSWRLIDIKHGGNMEFDGKTRKLETTETRNITAEITSQQQLAELQGLVLKGLTYYGRGIEIGSPFLHRLN